jgi:hypothetical protein
VGIGLGISIRDLLGLQVVVKGNQRAYEPIHPLGRKTLQPDFVHRFDGWHDILL